MFSAGAHWVSQKCGTGGAFAVAGLIIVLWAATGPFFNYSDTWQLIINTGTTIITFLMVFLIQATQNRDTAAIQLKLDELIRSNKDASNAVLAIEDKSDGAIRDMKARVIEQAPPPA